MLGFRQTSVHVFYFWFIRLHLPRRMNLFLFPLRTPRTRKRPPRARQVRENRPMARAPQTITPTAAPKIGHRARALPHAQSKMGHPRTRSPKSSPESAPLLPPRNPTKSPICAAGESRERQFIQQTRHFIQRPRKVLPLTGACLPLHCHQDRNEIQIKK